MEKQSKYRSPLEQVERERQMRKGSSSFFGGKENRVKRVNGSIETTLTRQRSSVIFPGNGNSCSYNKTLSNTQLPMHFPLPLYIPESFIQICFLA